MLRTALGSALRGRAARQEDRRSRRREAGDRTVRVLSDLRALFRSRESVRDPEHWIDSIRAAYLEIESNRYVYPRKWSHLARSLRSSIGEATSLSFADFWPEFAAQNASFNGTWLTFGEDYLEHVFQAVLRWREEHSNRNADRTVLRSFDDWLAATGRFRLGEGVWPDSGPGG